MKQFCHCQLFSDNTVAGGYKKKKEARAKKLAEEEAKYNTKFQNYYFENWNLFFMLCKNFVLYLFCRRVVQDKAEERLQMEKRKEKIMEANKK